MGPSLDGLGDLLGCPWLGGEIHWCTPELVDSQQATGWMWKVQEVGKVITRVLLGNKAAPAKLVEQLHVMDD